MIIINIKGGLGNQMFQYALYLAMKKAGKDVKICTEHFSINEHNKHIPQHGKRFLLEKVFNTVGAKASKKEIENLSPINNDYLSRLKRLLGFKKNRHIYEENIGCPALDCLLKYEDVFLDGYWQDVKYFNSARQEILKAYSFAEPMTGKNAETLRQMRERASVSIHVRRNDYLNSQMYVTQPEEYYQKSIQKMNQLFDSPVTFFVFSDDVSWCKDHFSSTNNEMVYVEWNRGDKSYLDMRLMSMCQGNIVTNSSFSIWAALLNQNPNKVVIRPQHYYTNPEMDKKYVWPEDWMTV